MSKLTGLFSRGPSYYLRVVLPNGHPASDRFRSGRVMLSLGACSRREAINKGLALRAEVLQGRIPAAQPDEGPAKPTPKPVLRLRDVFTKWSADKPRSADTLAACQRALRLYEEFSGDPPIQNVARVQGVDFRAWLKILRGLVSPLVCLTEFHLDHIKGKKTDVLTHGVALH